MAIASGHMGWKMHDMSDPQRPARGARLAELRGAYRRPRGGGGGTQGGGEGIVVGPQCGGDDRQMRSVWGFADGMLVAGPSRRNTDGVQVWRGSDGERGGDFGDRAGHGTGMGKTGGGTAGGGGERGERVRGPAIRGRGGLSSMASVWVGRDMGYPGDQGR